MQSIDRGHIIMQCTAQIMNIIKKLSEWTLTCHQEEFVTTTSADIAVVTSRATTVKRVVVTTTSAEIAVVTSRATTVKRVVVTTTSAEIAVVTVMMKI